MIHLSLESLALTIVVSSLLTCLVMYLLYPVFDQDDDGILYLPATKGLYWATVALLVVLTLGINALHMNAEFLDRTKKLSRLIDYELDAAEVGAIDPYKSYDAAKELARGEVAVVYPYDGAQESRCVLKADRGRSAHIIVDCQPQLHLIPAFHKMSPNNHTNDPIAV